MGDTKNKFNALTPEILDKNESIYTEALDYAFSNSNIKNIAITGIYGSGKSTVWKTYENYRQFKNVITVSLGKYEDNLDDTLININLQSKDMDNRVERQLINQILSQIKSKKIPLSKYKFKENISIKKLIFLVLMTLCFVISILLWIFKNELQDIIRDFNFNKIVYWIGIMFFLPITLSLFSFYRKNKLKLSKIKLKGTEADLKDENNDETILDRDIKEIVYLLNSSKSDVIVFEDLDRYDNVEIFTKLRELNFLLNCYVKANNDGRIIRFVYMLKDELFCSKNRTKFFDFILPIVPVVDSKTSENKLVSLLSDVENTPDLSVLANISLYIDDMRLLKNIVNEYIVYSNIVPLRKLDLQNNKLFALITLKNIFPNEFDLLQKDKGYIRSVFDKLEKKREVIINNFKLELAKIDEKIEFINNRIENNKFEAMALMIPIACQLDNFKNETWAEILKNWYKNKNEKKKICYSNNNNYYVNYESVNYEEFVNRHILTTEDKKSIIVKIPEEKYLELSELRSAIQKLKKEIRNVEIYTFKELISSMNSNERENLFLDDTYKITKNHYFPLIRFLIADGLLDETYWYYKGNFDVDTSKTLKRNDVIYMKGLLEGKKIDVLLDVETPNEIIRRLDISDFSRFNILNKNVLKKCLDKNLKEYVISITNSVDDNGNYEDLIKIINVFGFDTIQKYVDILLEDNVDNLVDILNLYKGDNVSAYQNILISILINSNVTPNKLELFSSHIEQNENVISLICEDKFKTFIDNIYYANIKFKVLNKVEINNVRLKQIENIQAYKLNIQNVVYIVKKLLGEKFSYGNLLSEIYQSEIMISTKECIEDNFVSFITEYIDMNFNGESYTNNENILIKILISDILDEYKISYVSKNQTIVTNIDELESIFKNNDLFGYLLNGDQIEFSKRNINSYWNMIETYGEEFINYLDRNIDYNNAKDILMDNKPICNTLINSSIISDKLFNFVLKYADEQINELESNLSEERVNALIQNNLINETDYNIKILLENSYDEELVMLANSEDEDIEYHVITKLLRYELSDSLIYMLVNSNINDENAMKLINTIKDSVLIERINQNKETIIKSIIRNGLSDNNINYICNNFNVFKLKDEFIKYLDDQNELDELDNENLNYYVMIYVLNNKNVTVDSKINLIIIKINNNTTNLTELKKYISTVKEIANLTDVWDNKYPILDNEYKQKIGQALINAKYVKERNDKEFKRIMVPKHF